jgi:hypothetical protein
MHFRQKYHRQYLFSLGNSLAENIISKESDFAGLGEGAGIFPA